MKKLYSITLASLLVAACAEDIDTNNISSQYITFNVTDNNILPQPEAETRNTSQFGQSDTFVPENSLFNLSTTADANSPAIDQTPIETDLDEDLVLITTVEDGIHLPQSESTTRGAQVSTGTFNFGVTEYKNGGAVVSTLENVSFSGQNSQTVHTGKTWESDAATNEYEFYAYYPYLDPTLDPTSNGLTLSSDKKTINYVCSSVSVADQQDLMTAYRSTQYTKTGVNLEFGHRLCAVKIALGTWTTGYTIKSVKFSRIIKSGTLNISDGSWTTDPDTAGELLAKTEEFAKIRYNTYKKLSE